MTAQPMKLKSGEWGAKTQGTAKTGQIITISTKSGKSWDARVERVLWSGNDRYGNGTVSIVATASLDRSDGFFDCSRGPCYGCDDHQDRGVLFDGCGRCGCEMP